ncbi:MAG: YicC/YloC family endoribonuclease [Acidobacteriota bacterium]
MIRSMTGFGRGEASRHGLRVTVEARTVNHRFCDLKARIPPELSDLEPDIRRRVQQSVRRGRVELAIALEMKKDPGFRVEIDRGLVDRYLKAARRIQKEFHLQGEIDIRTVMELPGAVKVEVERNSLDGKDSEVLFLALERALRALDRVRGSEGRHLRKDIHQRVEKIRKIIRKIAKWSSEAPQRIERKLMDRLDKISREVGVDHRRLAQEVALLAEKADITEEVVRLDGHLDQANVLLKGRSESSGKRLDFLVQEMLREANTIAAKTDSLDVSRAVLDVKAEVEKIREQVQNLE